MCKSMQSFSIENRSSSSIHATNKHYADLKYEPVCHLNKANCFSQFLNAAHCSCLCWPAADGNVKASWNLISSTEKLANLIQ